MSVTDSIKTKISLYNSLIKVSLVQNDMAVIKLKRNPFLRQTVTPKTSTLSSSIGLTHFFLCDVEKQRLKINVNAS